MKKIVFAIVLSMLSMGCSSLFKGTNQNVSFTSEPSGAEVVLDGVSQGVTPVVLSIRKNKYNSVMLTKKGYANVIRPLNKEYDRLALLNVFWDCSTTDFITGAAFEYEPSAVHFNLEKTASEAPAESEKPKKK